MSIIIITSVAAEARAIGTHEGINVVVGGIGRTNAAAATTQAILQSKTRVHAVINVGVGGALPQSNLKIGDCLVASVCIYHEEGLITPTGFVTMSSIGLPLGDFDGNHVPVDEQLLEVLSDVFPIGPIATVATCSGTDAAAAEVVRRTGAFVEAMEGAAVVHAARRLKVPAIELRVVSNTTGDRTRQQWNIAHALESLGKATSTAVEALQKRD